MRIDVTPTIEKADDIQRFIMNTYGWDAMYCVKLANDKEYTVTFNPESLAEFQPNKTVSEMMKQWQEGFQHTIDRNTAMLKTGYHDTHTVKQPKVKYVLPNGTEVLSRDEFEDVPRELDSYEKKSMRYWIRDAKSKLGKMKFIKFV